MSVVSRPVQVTVIGVSGSVGSGTDLIASAPGTGAQVPVSVLRCSWNKISGLVSGPLTQVLVADT